MSKISDTESDDDFKDACDNPTSSNHSSMRGEESSPYDELIKKACTSGQISDSDSDENVREPEERENKPKFEKEIGAEDRQAAERKLTPEQLEENKIKGEKLKAEGNDLFKNGQAMEAIAIYTQALNIMPLANLKERSILYANRAAAKLQIDSKKCALEDCNKSLELWPGYMRCLVRRAKLHESLENYDEALVDYKKIYELDPSNRDAQIALVRLPPLAEEKREKMKEEVLGKLKDLGNMFLKPFGLSTNNFQMTKDPNSGGYSINMKN